MPDADPDQMLWTVEQVCAALHIDTNTLTRLAYLGQFPAAIEMGDAVLWPKASVERWVDHLRRVAANKQVEVGEVVDAL